MKKPEHIRIRSADWDRGFSLKMGEKLEVCFGVERSRPAIYRVTSISAQSGPKGKKAFNELVIKRED